MATKETLKDVVAQIANDNNVSRGVANDVLKQAFAYINTSVNAGNEVRINDFGTFKLKERAARKGRNPATGEEIEIAASKSITFKPVKHAK